MRPRSILSAASACSGFASGFARREDAPLGKSLDELNVEFRQWGFHHTGEFASNEPWLSSALLRVGEVLASVQRSIEAERTILIGFSQGACLALEFAARNARRYGAVVGLSGGLIGPDGTPRDYAGSLEGTPVFLGCSDVDFHIPKERVDLSAAVLQQLGGVVEVLIL